MCAIVCATVNSPAISTLLEKFPVVADTVPPLKLPENDVAVNAPL